MILQRKQCDNCAVVYELRRGEDGEFRDMVYWSQIHMSDGAVYEVCDMCMTGFPGLAGQHIRQYIDLLDMEVVTRASKQGK